MRHLTSKSIASGLQMKRWHWLSKHMISYVECHISAFIYHLMSHYTWFMWSILALSIIWYLWLILLPSSVGAMTFSCFWESPYHSILFPIRKEDMYKEHNMQTNWLAFKCSCKAFCNYLLEKTSTPPLTTFIIP